MSSVWFLLGFVLVCTALIAYSIKSIPYWRRVAFYVTEQVNAGMSYEAVEQGLQERYKLSITEAKACVNHYGDIDWFEWQPFLQK